MSDTMKLILRMAGFGVITGLLIGFVLLKLTWGF